MFAAPRGPGTIPADGIGGFQMPQLDTSIGEPIKIPASAPQKKGGMFGGGKFGIKEALAFGLAGFMARRNPGLLQGLMGMMAQRQSGEREEQQYQQHRTDQYDDWVKQQAYKAANPEAPDPTAFQKDYSWYQQNLPGMAEQFAKAHADSGGSPFGRMFTDPTNGQQYMLPSQGGPQVGAVVDDPRKGGPASQAPGGFPGSY